MIFFFSILSVLFLLSISALILSIFHMVSSDDYKNIFIGVLAGIYSTSYIVVFIVFCYKNKKPKPVLKLVEVEGYIQGDIQIEVINQQIEGN